MPILDISEQNRSLDNDYGATHGTNAPTSHELVLFAGDPAVDGVELDGTSCPGYSAVAVANDAGWPAASEGRKSRLVDFPAPTGEWELTATHWGLRNPDTSGLADVNALAEPVIVPEAGGTLSIVVEVHHGPQIDVE